MKGPAAPKDPVEKRSCIYVILDKTISGSQTTDGKAEDHVYLEGRLRGQIEFTSGEINKEYLEMLGSVEGFRKLVHSVGVSLQAEDKEDEEDEVLFQLQCYGKSDKYVSGTHMEMDLLCDGMEMVLPIDAYPENDEDTIIGAFNFEFPKPNKNVKLTVKFYLNDGYEVPEIQVDPPVNFDSDDYKEMIDRCVISTGNNYRMKKVIEKAKKGEDMTIAYIGGSITQGAGGKPINTKCYARQSFDAFCKMFAPEGSDHIHYVKAGVGGTSSQFGMVRYDKDVCNNGEIEPDLVVIEFAVNDEGDETKGVSFESLLVKVLSAKNKPAVLINFAVFMNDWNLQDRICPIGERYEVPMVSVKEAVTPQFADKKVITKRQFFYDIFHPTNDGHRIMADCITKIFATIDAEEMAKEDITLDKEPVYGTQFKDIIAFERGNASEFAKIETKGFEAKDTDLQETERDMELKATSLYPDNWMKKADEEGEFKITVTAKSLHCIIKDSGAPDFGKADFYVDGELVRTIDSTANGWNHCNSCLIFDEKECKERVVKIKMHEGDENKKFTILAFGITK